MTLRAIVEQELNPETIQNNIEFLTKCAQNLQNPEEKQRMEAVIAGMKQQTETKQEKKQVPVSDPKSDTVQSTAQPGSTVSTAQLDSTGKTAQEKE